MALGLAGDMALELAGNMALGLAGALQLAGALALSLLPAGRKLPLLGLPPLPLTADIAQVPAGIR